MRTLAERFAKKVLKTEGDGCWLWTAAVNELGYGAINIGPGKRGSAHRVSYELNVGPIPRGLGVLHRCDNPSCVRPDHLFLGTHAENMADMAAKGRAKGGCKYPGELNHNAKITEDGVIDIRNRLVLGTRWRSGNAADLAAEYGLSKNHICQIAKRVFWKHIP